jgi:hypothetical protein
VDVNGYRGSLENLPERSPAMPPTLFGVRTAVVLLSAALVGLVAGALTYLATNPRNVPAAVLAGGSAAVAAAVFMNTSIG